MGNMVNALHLYYMWVHGEYVTCVLHPEYAKCIILVYEKHLEYIICVLHVECVLHLLWGMSMDFNKTADC